MSGLSLSEISVLLNEKVVPGIQNYLNANSSFNKRFRKSTRPFESGKYWRIPLQTGRNAQFGATSDTGELPYHGKPSFNEYRVYPKRAYIQFQVDGATLDFAGNNAEGMTNILEQILKDCRNEVNFQYNRMFFGTGSGRLAIVCTDYSGGTPTIIDVGVGLTSTDGGWDMAKNLRADQVLSVQEGNSATVRGQVTIASISHWSGSGTKKSVVTCVGDAPAAMLAGDVLVHGLQNSGCSYGQEAMGLLGHIDNGTRIQTYQNISSRSSYPWACAKVFANSGTLRDLTIPLMQQAKDSREFRTNKARNDKMIILMNTSMLYEYSKFSQPGTRFVPGGTKDVGMPDRELITFDGKEIVTETGNPYHKIFFLDESDFEVFEQLPFRFEDRDGSVLQRDASATANKHTFTGFGYDVLNSACNNPMSQTSLEDINQDCIAPE